MEIDAAREGGSVVVRLGGRLDREWAEHLSRTLEELLRDGVRSVAIDLSAVSYVSSAATLVLSRWQQELAALRGEVRLTSIPPAIQQTLAIAGWESRLELSNGGSGKVPDLRQSSWHMPAVSATAGQYQTSASVPGGALRCRLHGRPELLGDAAPAPEDCAIVPISGRTFALGLGAIGGSYDESRQRFGELVAIAGCIAYFPTDGARMADYLVGDGPTPPCAVLASGLSCEGAFSKLVRFSARADGEAVPLSEVAAVCLDASGARAAGLVIAGETAGLTGVRLRRSPTAEDGSPVRFEVPAVRDWLSFAPERTHGMTTTVLAGVIARAPQQPLATHLRPFGVVGRLYGHIHAAVFSYNPLPQRTVDLETLLKGVFRNHQLRDVLHLVWDDRGDAGVAESTLVRGVAWVAPIAEIS